MLAFAKLPNMYGHQMLEDVGIPENARMIPTRQFVE